MLQCPSPPTIKNGQHSSKDVAVFIPGTSVKYECDPGYVLTGKTTVSCLPSGTWSIPYPRCEGELRMLSGCPNKAAERLQAGAALTGERTGGDLKAPSPRAPPCMASP